MGLLDDAYKDYSSAQNVFRGFTQDYSARAQGLNQPAYLKAESDYQNTAKAYEAAMKQFPAQAPTGSGLWSTPGGMVSGSAADITGQYGGTSFTPQYTQTEKGPSVILRGGGFNLVPQFGEDQVFKNPLLNASPPITRPRPPAATTQSTNNASNLMSHPAIKSFQQQYKISDEDLQAAIDQYWPLIQQQRMTSQPAQQPSGFSNPLLSPWSTAGYAPKFLPR